MVTSSLPARSFHFAPLPMFCNIMLLCPWTSIAQRAVYVCMYSRRIIEIRIFRKTGSERIQSCKEPSCTRPDSGRPYLGVCVWVCVSVVPRIWPPLGWSLRIEGFVNVNQTLYFRQNLNIHADYEPSGRLLCVLEMIREGRARVHARVCFNVSSWDHFKPLLKRCWTCLATNLMVSFFSCNTFKQLNKIEATKTITFFNATRPD